MTFTKYLIILISFSTFAVINSRPCHKMVGKQLLNMQKMYYNNCINEAYKETNDKELYECIINNNNNCNTFPNYDKFITIKKNCIDDIDANSGACIFMIMGLLWLFSLCIISGHENNY